MTLELFRGGAYKYRVSATDPRLIERKATTRGGRWQEFALCQDAQQARARLLKLNRPKGERANE